MLQTWFFLTWEVLRAGPVASTVEHRSSYVLDVLLSGLVWCRPGVTTASACAVLCSPCITGLSYAGLYPVLLSCKGIKICSLAQVLLHDCSFHLINAFAIAISTTEVLFCWLMPFLSFSVSNFEGSMRTLL